MDSPPLVQVLLPVALLCGGISVGGLTASVVAAVPLRMSLPPSQAVYAHQFMVSRLDKLMPACLVVTMLSVTVAGFAVPSPAARVLCLLAAALQLAALVLSVVKLVPINTWLAQLDPANLPVDYAERDPRDRWRAYNLIRAGFVLTAWALIAVAVGVLL